ncbi:MAG: NAD(P)-binding protein [Oscillospiraceae bacterium]|nr:NAD(P)-binding protein [Oscillospiraceae bacterium]
MDRYDIAIIGGGISGLMCAYRVLEERPFAKIILFEKGHYISKRVCPIVAGKAKTCIKCPSCSIMEGLAGAGAFSDGKYVISTEYGGWLPDFLPKDTVIEYIEKADKVLMKFGAPEERFMPSDDLKRKCLEYDLHMRQAQLKHLGTDANFDTMSRMCEYLEERMDILCETEVTEVDKDSHTVTFTSKDGTSSVTADMIVFAVGRAGSNFFSKWCRSHGINMTNNQVDVGVRVELPAIVWDHFSKKIYEPKIWYRSKRYGDVTRMFCFNERGSVVMENTQGVLTVNGHAYKDRSRKTENSNFALLSTIRFTEPFKEPIEYARHVAELSNLISGGSVLVQRLGDLMIGRRTDAKRLRQSTVVPTLDAVPGDLSLCLPKRQLDNILETLEALDKVAPGTMNYDTLLYGIECKYYSARPETEPNFSLTGCRDIYCVGDGTGFTRSLSQAAAHGIYVADDILQKL